MSWRKAYNYKIKQVQLLKHFVNRSTTYQILSTQVGTQKIIGVQEREVHLEDLVNIPTVQSGEYTHQISHELTYLT